MQYEVEINGRLRQAIVHREDGQFVVEIDGKRWTVDAERVDAYTLSLLIGEVGVDAAVQPKPDAPQAFVTPRALVRSGVSRTNSYEVTVAPERSSDQFTVSVGATTIAVSLNGRRRSGRRGDGVAAGGGPQRIVAPMPGKIVRVLVKKGDAVHVRQAVVVIEAMKMENELRAGRDGIVAEIAAREGQSVEAGGLLAVITASAE